MNKAMKLVLCTVTSAFLAAAFIPALVGCDDETTAETGLFVFEQTEGGYTVTGVTDPSAKELIVPETYNGGDVTAVAEGAFQNCIKAEKAVIPSTVQSIGKNAFRGCRALGSLTIPFTGQKAGASAEKGLFGYIFGQADYVGAAEVKQVFGQSEEENETFYIPSALKEVRFEGTSIPYGAFSNCTSVTTMIIGSLTESVGEEAFLNNNLAYVYVESNAVAAQLLGPQSASGRTSTACRGMSRAWIRTKRGSTTVRTTRSTQTGNPIALRRKTPFFRADSPRGARNSAQTASPRAAAGM